MTVEEALELAGNDYFVTVLYRHAYRAANRGYDVQESPALHRLAIPEIVMLCRIQGVIVKPRQVARKVSLARKKLSELGVTVMPLAENGWAFYYREPGVKNVESSEVA